MATFEEATDRPPSASGAAASPRLVVRAAAVEAIRRHARASYPEECCGALVGRDGVVEEAWPLANATEDGARRRFLVRPEDYRAVEQRARAAKVDLVGFYHSHPDHPARPSPSDLEHAWPTFVYLIVSVVGGEPRDLTAWQLDEERRAFREQEWQGEP